MLLFLARPWSRQCGRRAIRLPSVCKRFFLMALFVLLIRCFITALQCPRPKNVIQLSLRRRQLLYMARPLQRPGYSYLCSELANIHWILRCTFRDDINEFRMNENKIRFSCTDLLPLCACYTSHLRPTCVQISGQGRVTASKK